MKVYIMHTLKEEYIEFSSVASGYVKLSRRPFWCTTGLALTELIDRGSIAMALCLVLGCSKRSGRDKYVSL